METKKFKRLTRIDKPEEVGERLKKKLVGNIKEDVKQNKLDGYHKEELKRNKVCGRCK